MKTHTPPPRCRILGVDVAMVNVRRALDEVAGFVARRETRTVCFSDVHSIMRAQEDPAHRAALAAADLVMPDGQPLAWTGRLRGHAGVERVCGPDFLTAFCRATAAQGWGHYFYGGADGVAHALAERLAAQAPGLVVAGAETPPFRALSEEERQETLARIRASGARVLWVGLGCPKQEKWLHDNGPALEGIVCLGVGAAFDFATGRVRRAPRVMRRLGLEWLHRLASEPRRLWRRYLVLAPRFVLATLMESRSGRARLPPADPRMSG
ncbi:WecB/TagA/CpsF family glycosyltransferase [Salinarimonas chemoclinalis]|uniref:WecB/TagA/CpsF family glycosyltransferase n=1 Tax=Salinarimonas chemoclinalis TaxID=3241599 RepID=UPI00355809FA